MTSPSTHTANAIAAITNRHNIPIPEIDFTQHQLENGEVVSTTERVVKDVSLNSIIWDGYIGYEVVGRSRGCSGVMDMGSVLEMAW